MCLCRHRAEEKHADGEQNCWYSRELESVVHRIELQSNKLPPASCHATRVGVAFKVSPHFLRWKRNRLCNWRNGIGIHRRPSGKLNFILASHGLVCLVPFVFPLLCKPCSLHINRDFIERGNSS